MKEENDINKVYNYCTLLNYDCVKEELEGYLKGYNVDNILKIIDNYLCTLSNKYNHEARISIGEAMLKLTLKQPFSIEEIEIQGNIYTSIYDLLKNHTKVTNLEKINTENKKNDISLKIRRIEKRPNGIIVTDVFKTYSPWENFNEKYVLSDLREIQFIFTKAKLEQTLYNFNFDKAKLSDILSRIKLFENRHNLKELSDFCTSASILIMKSKGLKSIFTKNNDLPIQMYLNGDNLSNLYNSIDGYDKLTRIYDLTNGIINKRNEKDIDAIRLGSLSTKCFDLKDLKGINNTIDKLIGKQVNYSVEYMDYLEKLFKSKYKYNGNVDLNRDNLIKIIVSKPKKPNNVNTNPVLTKKIVSGVKY